MTTQVMISNMSRGEHAKTIKVEVMGRDHAGHFVSQREVMVEPGTFVQDLYVYDSQHLQVHEVKGE